MFYTVDLEDAVRFGERIALILSHFKHFTTNISPEICQEKDGKIWIKSPLHELCTVFPWLKKDSIQRSIQKMIIEDVLLVNKLGADGANMTSWYALGENAYVIENKHFAKTRNAFLKNEKWEKNIGTSHALDNNINNILFNNNINTTTKKKEKEKINQKQKEKFVKKSTTSDALFLFNHWQKVYNHSRAKLDQKRRRKINQALTLGFTVDELVQAINGLKCDEFLMGANPGGKCYDDLTLILRDAEHIEKFIGLYAESQFKLPGVAKAVKLVHSCGRNFSSLEWPLNVLLEQVWKSCKQASRDFMKLNISQQNKIFEGHYHRVKNLYYWEIRGGMTAKNLDEFKKYKQKSE